MQLRFYRVNAFSESLFSGNPAAVLLLDSRVSYIMDDDLRQRVATEMNLSETSFVELYAPSDSFARSREFKLRWFTPAREVPLCGHATLAAAAALLSGEENMSDEVGFETVYSGRLSVRRAPLGAGDEAFEMSLPLETTSTEVPDFARPGRPLIEAVLGSHSELLREVRVCRRLGYLLVVLRSGASRRDLEAVRPDTRACLEAASSDEVQLIIVTAGAPPDSQHDFVSRCFAPWCGIEEDPVTGSAHGVLAPFWAGSNGKDTQSARQCSRRGGELQVTIDQQNGRVKLLAKAKIVVKGALCLPEGDAARGQTA